MNKKAFVTSELTVVLIAINIILLVSVIIVGINISKEKPEEETGLIGEFGVGEVQQREPGVLFIDRKPVTGNSKIIIDDIKLCKSITDDVCEETNNFNVNENIYAMITVSGFFQTKREEGWLFNIREYMITIDPEGDIVLSMTNFVRDFKEYKEEKQESMILTNRFFTFFKIVQKGEYTIKFILVDQLTGANATEEKRFNLI